jgi:AcrR family transcriptional regulator
VKPETDAPTGSGGIRAEQADATRRRILDVGRDLFADKGYDATAVAEIATRARVPKGLVFYYYPSKIRLLLAIIEEESPAAQISHLKIRPVAGDLAGTVSRIAGAFRRSAGGSADVRRIIYREASAHPEVRHAMARLNQAAVDAVRDAIDTALGPDSPVPPNRRNAAAQALVGAGLYELNLRRAAGTSLDLPTIATLIADGLDQPT